MGEKHRKMIWKVLALLAGCKVGDQAVLFGDVIRCLVEKVNLIGGGPGSFGLKSHHFGDELVMSSKDFREESKLCAPGNNWRNSTP